MTLFTCRGRHHSSSRGRGAWGQCCHVEQLPLWALTALLGFSVLRLSIRSPALAEERAYFLDRRHIARVHSRTSTDISAIPDVAASRITRRIATATSTLLTCRGAAAISTPHTQGSGCEINASQTISRRQLVMARPRASRSSSHRDERWEGCRV